MDKNETLACLLAYINNVANKICNKINDSGNS